MTAWNRLEGSSCSKLEASLRTHTCCLSFWTLRCNLILISQKRIIKGSISSKTNHWLLRLASWAQISTVFHRFPPPEVQICFCIFCCMGCSCSKSSALEPPRGHGLPTLLTAVPSRGRKPLTPNRAEEVAMKLWPGCCCLMVLQQKGTGMAGEFQQELGWHSEKTKCGPVSRAETWPRASRASFIYINKCC